jgi:hypothetical protein
MSPDRLGQIIRLIQTRHDGLPEMHHPQIRGAQRGFVHRTIAAESCPDCLANGRTMTGCETCKGTGRIETFQERDPYAESKIQPYGITPEHHEARQARESELARLGNQTKTPDKSEAELVATTPPEQWEIQRRRMYRDYDYAALDRALEQLAIAYPNSRHAIALTLEYGTHDTSATVQGHVNLGLTFISEHMPDKIRAPDDEKHPALIRRDRNAEKRNLA